MDQHAYNICVFFLLLGAQDWGRGEVTGVVGDDVETILGLVAAVDDFGFEVVFGWRGYRGGGSGGGLRAWHCGHEGEEAQGRGEGEGGEMHDLLGWKTG